LINRASLENNEKKFKQVQNLEWMIQTTSFFGQPPHVRGSEGCRGSDELGAGSSAVEAGTG